VPPVPYLKLAAVKDAAAFRGHCRSVGIDLPCDDALLASPESPLAQPLQFRVSSSEFQVRNADANAERGTRNSELNIGNRLAVNPMEGWDGTLDGFPSEKTVRRWQRFGESGAKLIWGGEAVAVRPDGRANPNQVMLHQPEHKAGIAQLRDTLLQAHRERYGETDDLLLGLQLTHSGRFCRPNDKKRMEPRILYYHPLLDSRFGLPSDYPLMTDGEIRALIEEFIRAATWAAEIGFHFVDLKHCHGYLGHEFLSAYTREGDYGGSLENRTRFLREMVEGIRSAAPGLEIGVRLSAFDLIPFHPDPEQSSPGHLGPGIPVDYSGCLPYLYAFGANPDRPTEVDLTETFRLFEIFEALGISLVNVTAGSPYYNPHIQRPALYPPSDGYTPPEDPLVGVARQMSATREIKRRFPHMTLVGTAYTYLQEFFPNVAQAAVREGWVDAVGLGRMVLAYPWLPGDLLSGETYQTKLLCRTFSDCTTAPRNGLVSGCYPLDVYYKRSEEAKVLTAAKYGDRVKTRVQKP
jgi:2,4-dienoyl-CoA reductase-like NADH-dependent reductase (Old Yellow Enzyme family)